MRLGESAYKKTLLPVFVLEFFHDALDQLFGVGQALHDDLDVHHGLAWPALALAVDAVLPDQRHGIGDRVHRDGQTSTGNTHHGLVVLQFLPLLFEYRHATIVTVRAPTA